MGYRPRNDKELLLWATALGDVAALERSGVAGASGLIFLARGGDYAKAAISSLKRLLLTEGSRIRDDDLKLIASFPETVEGEDLFKGDPLSLQYDYWYDVIGCTEVKKIAQRELTNRGGR